MTGELAQSLFAPVAIRTQTVCKFRGLVPALKARCKFWFLKS